MNKSLLRAEILKKRDALPEKTSKSQIICNRVINSGVFTSAKTVFVYLAFKSEVETEKIIQACFEAGKTICVPVIKTGCFMDAVKIDRACDLIFNEYGICEPADKSKIVDKREIDLCIVPGSVFDKDLNRIGYGKGFYDRFLNGENIIKIAPAFDCQIVDKAYTDVLDVKMDAVVTELQIFGEL